MKFADYIYTIVSLIIFIGVFEIKAINLLRRCVSTLYVYITYIFLLFHNISKTISRKVNPKKTKRKQYYFSIEIKYFIFGVSITLIFLFLYNSYIFIQNLPNPNLIGKINYPVSTQIFDRNGILLYEIYKNENRIPIFLSQIPKHVIQATIAMEDQHFYQHSGVSFFGGIMRAIIDSYQTKSLQGGSTITQQLVKTALLSPERTVIRKIKEIILALWTERLYTKDRILEMYFNQVAYGGSSYGIEQASKMYFGKHVWELTLEEGAMLAGLPQAPSVYSPHVNPDKANARKNQVLKLMLDQHFIDSSQYKKAVESQLTIIPFSQPIRAPHFVFYVRSEMEKQYGIRQVEEGGFQVITTLDFRIQEKAEKILNEELKKVEYLNINNGAILVLNPQNGEILAMVGSKNYFDDKDGAFNVTIALRQPGSSIKPIMYSLAIEKKILTAASILDDSPVSYVVPGSAPYKPVNYDGIFHGRVPMRYALANSYNIPAVKTMNMLGVDNFIKHARLMGITTWEKASDYGLSLSLGGGEVTMMDMASAYSVFANKGRKITPEPFIKIQNHKGKNIYLSNKSNSVKVISEETAFIISDILSDNFARQFAFGRNSLLEIPGKKVAVKTGTTDLKKDNWTIGYNASFVVVSWVGNNDGTPMNPYLSSGVTGAAPIWNRMMTYLINDYQTQKNENQHSNTIYANEIIENDIFVPPSSLVKKKCYYGRDEYFIAGTEKNMCGTVLNPTPTPTSST